MLVASDWESSYLAAYLVGRIPLVDNMAVALETTEVGVVSIVVMVGTLAEIVAMFVGAGVIVARVPGW